MEGIANKRLWFILEGIFVGFFGLIILILAGIFGSTWLYGLGFLLTSVVVVLRSFITYEVPGLTLTVFSFLVYLVAGIVLLVKYSADTEFVLVYLSVIFWIIAACNFVISLMRLKSNNWGFLLISSLITAVIGCVTIVQPEDTSSWSISILFAAHLIIYGACQFMTGATAARSKANQL